MSQKSDKPTEKVFQQDKPYAVFLSFNSEDREAVEKIAQYLEDKAELPPWFDQWHLIPGEDWVDGLYRGLEESTTCAVFVGKSGEGPWQKQEVKAALIKQANNPNFRVIPVLLPAAPKQPELPPFLPARMWVDFRQKGLDDDDALWRLECGICGKPPGRGRPIPRPEETPYKRQEAPEQAKTKSPATEKTEPEQPEPETEIEKGDSEQLEWKEKIRPEPKIAEITREKREIRKDKRTKRVSLRTKMLLLAGVGVLLVAGVILFISVIKPVPTIRLRSEPLTVSDDEFKEVFGLDKTGHPRKYIQNNFEDQDKVVIDHATGLMWQKSGSSERLPYKEVQAYIDQLNNEGFADYDDWRLPTVEELMSLLEPETQSNDLYINPIFDEKQSCCWSADQSSSGAAWIVYFNYGYVNLYYVKHHYYVRVVRSRQ